MSGSLQLMDLIRSKELSPSKITPWPDKAKSFAGSQSLTKFIFQDSSCFFKYVSKQSIKGRSKLKHDY